MTRTLLVTSFFALLGGVSPACGRVGLISHRRIRDHDAAPRVDATPSVRFDAAGNDGSLTHDAGRVRDAASTHDVIITDGAPPMNDGSVPPIESGPLRDAVTDVADGRDAPVAPDCRCPPGDYYVNTYLNGSQTRLSSPFQLGLYCDETAPQLANPACGSVRRLSACAGPQNAPPCLYIAMDGQTPITGFFLDATGQTFSLVSAAITPIATVGRLALGTFSATYASQTSEASVQFAGSFHVCTVLFQPCGT